MSFSVKETWYTVRDAILNRWARFLTRWVIFWGRPALEEPAKKALRRITLEGLCPPDTVSMGIQNGGCAVFFRHDKGTEVFIGRDYEHAADEFLKWMQEQKSRGPDYTPATKTSTKLNRAQRRAYASTSYRNSQKKPSKRR